MGSIIDFPAGSEENGHKFIRRLYEQCKMALMVKYVKDASLFGDYH